MGPTTQKCELAPCRPTLCCGVLCCAVLCCSVMSRCNQRLDECPARATVRGLYRIQREKSRRDPVNVSVLVCKYAKDVAGPVRDSREQSRRGGRKPLGRTVA